MTTLKDIAEKAGVSQITVSRVINGYPHVSKKTRDRVLKVIEEMDYKPNQIARSLVTKKTNTLGILVSNITNPFYPGFIMGAEHRARQLGYSIIICNARSREAAVHNLNVLMEKQVDGIIITSLELDEQENLNQYIDNLSQILIDRGIPMCLVNERVNNRIISCVLNDNYLAAVMAMNYLYELGHRKIAHINHYSVKSSMNQGVWVDRFNGYKDSLDKFNLPLKREYIACNIDTAAGGYQAAKELLKLKDRPTAIFAANDQFGIGAISALLESGIKVPDQISVIGNDGIELGDMIYPKLTSVSLNNKIVGQTAVKCIVDRIENKSPSQDIILRPTLLKRQSTAKYIE